jgi:hypothetical protein|tara:strand:- start:110 stop:310 length:201 start_codon:yes stop_codon:yes gene_type:complete
MNNVYIVNNILGWGHHRKNLKERLVGNAVAFVNKAEAARCRGSTVSGFILREATMPCFQLSDLGLA